MKQIPFSNFKNEVSLDEKEYIAALRRVLYSGSFILGKEVKEFEKQFAEFVGAKHCIGVANGLEALQIALMAQDIGPDDEVITTPLSAVATTLAILAVGAKPIFVDTTKQGLINVSLIPQAITKKTKAILPVHLYGQACDIESLQEICKKNKLYLIEDAAQAHGSFYKGDHLGTFGDVGCFSFYPTKNLGAFGDAGAIVTSNAHIAEICRQIRDYGQASKYVHVRYGLNSRLDELQAAILKIRLKSLKKNNEQRQLLAKRYLQNLRGLPLEIVTSAKYEEENNFHLFVLQTAHRDKLKSFLFREGIETLVHYPVIIPKQPFLAKQYKNTFSIAEILSRNILSLPCNQNLKPSDIDYVCEKIKEFFLQDL